MSVYDMEDFSSLMELERWDSEVGLMTQSDDLTIEVGQNVYSTEDVKSRMPDVFRDVLESPVCDADPFAEDWMEQTSLSQMLEELTGMVVDSTIPSAPAKVDLVTSLDTVDESVFADLGLDELGLELLQQLVEKATDLDSNMVSSIESDSAIDYMQSLPEITPVISLNDSGIDSMNGSLVDVSLIEHNVNESVCSPLSGSEVDSLFSSAPVSPSTSISSLDCSSELYKLMTQTSPNSSSSHKSFSPYSSPSTSTVKKSKVKSVSTDSSDIQSQFLNKKEKKKLQNKNAAIRYRQKKKIESDDIRKDEDGLEDENKQLSEKVDELQREILYMKNLMSEVYKARGIVKITKVTITH